MLAGKTFSNDDDTGISGAMANNGAVVITPGTANQAIATGHHDGTGYVVGDTDLISANIKSGISIFGISGNSNVVDTSAGDATAAQILSGKKAYVDGALVTGTIASKAAATITPGTANQTIAAGQYLSGIQTISGDADLIAANIKSGIGIFGVTGSAVVPTTYESGSVSGSSTSFSFTLSRKPVFLVMWMKSQWMYMNFYDFVRSYGYYIKYLSSSYSENYGIAISYDSSTKTVTVTSAGFTGTWYWYVLEEAA